ncbi:MULTISPECIES: metallophosphoesterase family protein [Paenibacillus]|uniref:Metallophosphatase family protein n=1 Tax=Paenibacillus campinasensis TaxID=66347 RepID=A0A268EU15_9BACL|nr:MULTISPECIES: metallophosphoesterase family protein [Paenibacillus]PAD76612.1 metallophosphatase family protein [Paenibacillus campinasensis]PAK55652.1 metallophosphatase family protein [Paenibacillus sp. 7541]
MDRIAIISDIHGNIPALSAVLDDIRSRGVDVIYCLGDLIGKGPDGDIAVDMIQANCERIVRGNWDDFIVRKTEEEALRWHQRKLGQKRLDTLAKLPFCIEFYMSGKWVRLFHASPRSVYERVQPWDELEKRLSLFEGSACCLSDREADVAGYGDVHNAYLQHLDGKTLFNTGSVGNPLDMPQASYVILEGRYDSRTSAALSMQWVRVPYDIERAVQDAVSSGMPFLDNYIEELRTGRYRSRS